ncbi:hypothetical protein CN378_12875 [Bacillus sp. AFS015802]|uniref:DUF3221 domain-containing protein n=1 Tax=Bacillus sp. AFS015802 TaxID=2033486 RepID=UPI000BF803EB|nr:DUF3221 domain-containing protein [Bacillus sp. AFS015802]PFA66788.1 hypothetical protein CN378_12875 [Bacillus sp. AFS015802]
MSGKSRLLLMVLISMVLFLLSGCLNSHYDGIICAKNDEFNRVLVIQNVSKELIEEKEIGEIIKLAQKNDGIWFGVQKEKYEKLNIGVKVEVEYSKNGNTLTSDPPITGAKNIKVIE